MGSAQCFGNIVTRNANKVQELNKDNALFAQLVEAISNRSGLTGYQIAERLNIESTYLSRLRNRRATPSKRLLLDTQKLLDEMRAKYPPRPELGEVFPPDKTIVIPQGVSAKIVLECSTNLVDWVPAKLGNYSDQPTTKFFRLRAEKL